MARLADDSNEGKKKREFFLVIRPHQAVSDLRREVDAKLKGLPHDAAVHERGKQYKRGALVTHGGSVFIARCDTSADIGGDSPSPDWRLFCQRGKSAR